MAKRKPRKRSRTRKKKSEPLAGWIWMLFGLAVGLSVAAAIYIKDREVLPIRVETETPAPSPRATSPKPKPAEPSEPRFDFYELLPNFEMVVPEEDLDARPDVETADLETPGAYVLQAGSFSTFEDADRRKAELALLGIESRIQKVSVDERSFHRVRIGPVEDLDRLNGLRARLREARVEVMVIRVAD